jgi:A/G-specific adenine glycosylase
VIGDLKVFRRKLRLWYDRHRRDLPWRTPLGSDGGHSPDPYHVLLSETMLQQTQVATVVPYFERFLQRFPTLEHLAQAPEQDVLRLWQGLGYYSRARNLQKCARQIVGEHQGQVPNEVATLLRLPGVGRYTAGAIASLAFDVRAPILDGNVTRALCRIDRIESDPRDREIQASLWRRAEEILPDTRVGDFNSALMELGATVCTPRNPQCLLCPVRAHCESMAAGAQERIPVPKKSAPTPLLERWVFCAEHQGHYLIQQRPPKGRWAGMWQFATVEPGVSVIAAARQVTGGEVSRPVRLGEVRHALTHRRYRFEAFTCRVTGANGCNSTSCRWVTLAELDHYPLPKPHLRIAQWLAGGRMEH